MRKACFTVDVDRDVNFSPERGGKACSADRGCGTEPRFVSSKKGTEMIVNMLDDIGIMGTFFCEATTLSKIDVDTGSNEIALHGLDHEDLSLMDDEETERTLSEACGIIKDITGSRPKGFRAPFMRLDNEKYRILERIGMEYDSSRYSDPGTSYPYNIGNITEIPVACGFDNKGKRITAYLWPMHEGLRGPKDHIELAYDHDGIFVMATHTWHMAESFCGGPMSNKEIERNLENTKYVITSMIEMGFEFVTMNSLM